MYSYVEEFVMFSEFLMLVCKIEGIIYAKVFIEFGGESHRVPLTSETMDMPLNASHFESMQDGISTVCKNTYAFI